MLLRQIRCPHIVVVAIATNQKHETTTVLVVVRLALPIHTHTASCVRAAVSRCKDEPLFAVTRVVVTFTRQQRQQTVTRRVFEREFASFRTDTARFQQPQPCTSDSGRCGVRSNTFFHILESQNEGTAATETERWFALLDHTRTTIASP